MIESYNRYLYLYCINYKYSSSSSNEKVLDISSKLQAPTYSRSIYHVNEPLKQQGKMIRVLHTKEEDLCKLRMTCVPFFSSHTKHSDFILQIIRDFV